MTAYCLACDEDGAPCECLAPCPGCGALSGYTCRSDCPNMADCLARRAREEDNDRNDDWDDGPSPESIDEIASDDE